MSTDSVERSITIDAPAAEIFSRVADFRRWIDWSPWEGLDPELHRSYTGSASGTGASYAGVGKVDLRFDKPFKACNEMSLEIKGEGSGSVVRWAMSGKKTFATRVMGVFKSMDALVRPDFAMSSASSRSSLRARSAPSPRLCPRS